MGGLANPRAHDITTRGTRRSGSHGRTNALALAATFAGAAQRRWLLAAGRWDVSADLPRLTMPITLVRGERAGLIPLATAETIRAAQPTAEVITLSNASRLPQADAPGAVVGMARGRMALAPAPMAAR